MHRRFIFPPSNVADAVKNTFKCLSCAEISVLVLDLFSDFFSRVLFKTTAETFRSDGSFDLQEALGQLAIGEALVSLLDEHGTPGIAQRAMIAPPTSRLGAISPTEREALVTSSPIQGLYEKSIDRESAYELLTKKVEEEQEESSKDDSSRGSLLDSLLGGGSSKGERRRQNPLEAMITSAARSIGSQLGRSLSRGIFGSVAGRGRRG